ncbi:hypothetical protein C0995_000688 [Termitomyces sp. Mi166|nr:hypothetical protein C0995_000688 [Termitomyces sp. Mi166\
MQRSNNRRRLIQYGLSRPGPPVYTQQQQPDGSIQRQYIPGVSADLSRLSDEDLDTLMLDIYEQFPSFGRRMIDGYLLRLGERVPCQRIIDSYSRAIGPTTSTFAPRRIQRRVYSVPGPNSFWHHDGQHGIRAHNNNRAETVLQLFEDISAVFGYPSRVGITAQRTFWLLPEWRKFGDKVEAHISGGGQSHVHFYLLCLNSTFRSVHNIRLERLWVDVTRGAGKKWKDLFRHLEVHDGLNADNDAHIWHLFLSAINTDLEVWTKV